MDISEDEETLWVVNLFDRTLIELPIGNPAVKPSTYTAHDINAWVEANMPCTDGEFRPWALKVHDGLVYVGGVCSAEYDVHVIGSTNPDLVAYVLAHDPDAADGNFTSVFTFGLNYDRGIVSHDGTFNPPAEWRPWIDLWSDMTDPVPPGSYSKQAMHPQPILADIEFDESGAMILGLIDRFGHQSGNANYSTDTSDTFRYEGTAPGDILRACKSGSAYVLESNGSCGGVTTGGAGNAQGPSGGEYYYEDYYTGTHDDVGTGSLALILGTGEVAFTSWDPDDEVRSAGVRWFDHADGTMDRAYEINGQSSETDSSRFGKAAGLGDLEVLCEAAPLEIGNRVWLDIDEDGIQDPSEPPIANVTVQLYASDGSLVDSVETAADGTWYFNSATTSGLYVNTAYYIVIAVAEFQPGGDLRGYAPTVLHQGTGLHDSDATRVNPPGLGTQVGTYYTTGAPGHNDHTLDFGLDPAPTAVTLTAFNAIRNGAMVDVTWQTSLEIGTAGFNIWRSTGSDNVFKQVNDVMIPPTAPGSVTGGSYVYTDEDVVPEVTYSYMLVEIETSGRQNQYGPVVVDGAHPSVVQVTSFQQGYGVSRLQTLLCLLVSVIALGLFFHRKR